MHFSKTEVISRPAVEFVDSYERMKAEGFSRQEHWSGLPFPSPMHESEK